ncbi:MAG: hypothetical protein P4L85_06735 [Paludisphaera borealis]|uniref:hypothetical protein n=1 Tax=Paludisphaera borealis TaxID=1387353 RepID=UPI002848A809|nr:hypothetical protein [Paludisphaera borealis]MDR3619031.1 hypothetical protein [Paludisphaera borealis]
MRTPRMNTRRWMLVVAIVGLVLAAGIQVERLFRLRSEYLAKRSHFAEKELLAEKAKTAALRGVVSGTYESEEALKYAKTFELLARRYGRLRAKYERASWHPWIAVVPDYPRGLDPSIDPGTTEGP